ncbi:MAG: aminoimidazole riboside kinase [Candidatus Schmidhempelia sp.]|nr:aminoimidazole riboside kinase [Candidatus Schmidhempelia sp.]
MQKTKILALGDAVVDLIPTGDMNYRACAGGAPANVAIGVAKLGNISGFIGRVGNDPFGHFMEKTLLKYGVDCQYLEKDQKQKTSTVVVDLAENGERSFTFLVSPSADQFLSPAAIPTFKQDILHFCSLALVATICRNTLSQAIQALKQRNGLISFDINLREQMWADHQQMRQLINSFGQRADILKLSDEELYWLTEKNNWHEALQQLTISYHAPLKIVTNGANGCCIICHNHIYHFDSYKVNCMDTTGAGDAFVAGLLSSIALSGLPQNKLMVETMVTIASACGALATTKKGAVTALPDSQFLQNFIQENPALTAKN